MNGKINKNEQKIFKIIGMRTLKTAIATFICLLISSLRKTDPLNSVISAIVTMKSSPQLGIYAGTDRVIGTVIGGIYGYLTIIFSKFFGINILGIPYYGLLSLILIPVTYTTIYFNTAESVQIAAIVYVIVTVSMAHAGDIAPLVFVIERVVDTIIGIGVSVFVNWAI